MSFKKISLFFVIALQGFYLFSAEPESYNIQKQLLTITNAAPPRVTEDFIIFTFKSNEKPLFVGAAFDFDNYVKIYHFKKNQEGIYTLVIPKPERNKVMYRLIVDGLWMSDPFNPYSVQGANLSRISVIDLSGTSRGDIFYPFTKEGVTYFQYKGESGKNVYLAGNFNRWDPYMYHMAETSPGVYNISLKLPPGKHSYYFVINGTVVADKLNEEVMWDSDYREVSVYRVSK